MKTLFIVMALSSFSFQSAQAGGLGDAAAQAGIDCVGAATALSLAGAAAAKKLRGASVKDSALTGIGVGCSIGLVSGGISGAMAADAPEAANLNEPEAAAENE